MVTKTYRCALRPEGVAEGEEIEADDPEDAAEEYLLLGDEDSLAADLVGTDLDREHAATVYVLDPDTGETVSVDAKVTAEVDYRVQTAAPKAVTP